MEIQLSQEELDKYAKQSKKIIYSTNVLKQENKLIRRELKGTTNGNLWAIILNYEIKDGINQEVILGTLRTTNDRRRKISDIEGFISNQLEQNLEDGLEYTHYEKLKNYIKSENIPFELSTEGKAIMLCKSEEQVEIPRTMFENDKKELITLYTKDQIQEMETKLISVFDEERQRKIEEKWKMTREKIFKEVTLEEKEKFLLGERIAEIVQKTENDDYDNKKMVEIKNKFKRKAASKYLLEVFDNEQGFDDIQSTKFVLLDFYINMKEKGLASDVISSLEFIEKKLFFRCQKQNGEINEKDLSDIEEIQKYIQFFNIVKAGKDWNSRLYALKIGKINFDKLNLIIENVEGKDSELLEYVKLKEEVINETQAENIKLKESKYPSVKKLYNFILNSESRENIKNDEEYLVEKVFEQYKSDLVRENTELIDIYNHYARIYNRFVCPTSIDAPRYSDVEIFGEEENEGR